MSQPGGMTIIGDETWRARCERIEARVAALADRVTALEAALDQRDHPLRVHVTGVGMMAMAPATAGIVPQGASGGCDDCHEPNGNMPDAAVLPDGGWR